MEDQTVSLLMTLTDIQNMHVFYCNNSLFIIYPKEILTYVHKKAYTRFFTAALFAKMLVKKKFIKKKWKYPNILQ